MTRIEERVQVVFIILMVPFGPLGDLPATATVQARINTAFDNLFHHDKDGRRHAVVCTFCDEYILSRHDRNFFPIKLLRLSMVELHIWQWGLTRKK